MKLRLMTVLILPAAVFAFSVAIAETPTSDELSPEAIEARICRHRMGKLTIRIEPGS